MKKKKDSSKKEIKQIPKIINNNDNPQLSKSTNKLTVVSSRGFNVVSTKVPENFFEQLLITEMELNEEFSMEKLTKLLSQYSMAIEFYYTRDFMKSKAYQNRMEYLLTNKELLMQLKRSKDNKNEQKNKNNNDKKGIKEKRELKHNIKLRQGDIDEKFIKNKITNVLNKGNAKNDDSNNVKKMIDDDIKKQDESWKNIFKNKKKIKYTGNRIRKGNDKLNPVESHFLSKMKELSDLSLSNNKTKVSHSDKKLNTFKFNDLAKKINQFDVNEKNENKINEIKEEDENKIEEKKEEEKQDEEKKVEEKKEEEKKEEENKKDNNNVEEKKNEDNKIKENKNGDNKIEEQKNDENNPENVKEVKKDEEIKKEENKPEEKKEEEINTNENKSEIIEKNEDNKINEEKEEAKKEEKIKEEEIDELKNKDVKESVIKTLRKTSLRRASTLEEDFMKKIKPDDEICNPINEKIQELQNMINKLNGKEDNQNGNIINEEEEESDTNLIKITKDDSNNNNFINKIPAKFQDTYYQVQNIIYQYMKDFNEFFYKDIFDQFSSGLKELYELKYNKYIEIRNEYHNQIKEYEFILENDDTIDENRKNEITQTIDSLNEEQQHQIATIEDEFNRKIMEKISEFKMNSFKKNSGIQLLEEQVKLDIYSIINDSIY